MNSWAKAKATQQLGHQSAVQIFTHDFTLTVGVKPTFESSNQRLAQPVVVGNRVTLG